MTKSPESAPLAALWHEGWYSPAKRLDSPNFERRPNDTAIDLLVIHSISLPPGKFGNGNVHRLFTNQLDWNGHPYFESLRGLKVSAHFFVTRMGELWQFVSCDARAWHAGTSTYCGRDNCNDYSIGIELEGLEGDRFDPRQYASLAMLCRAIACNYPVRHVAGHEHIAPGRKCDPGPGFDWALLKNQLAASGLESVTLGSDSPDSSESNA
jgi:AmpD protein